MTTRESADMIRRLITYIAERPPEEVIRLGVEDMALCSVWLQSTEGSGADAGLRQAIQGAVRTWTGGVRPAHRDTEGRRQQPILRRLIHDIRRARVGRLQRAPLDFLCTVFDLIQQTPDPASFARLFELLSPHGSAMKIRRDSLEPATDLDVLFRHVTVVTPKELREAENRLVKVFAGIEMPCRGPVYTDVGHLKITCDVPEDCIVVVEKGSCNICGYVMGRVAAKEHCEVRENISGVVVVRDGNIRARNLLRNAYVVSKGGSVFCRNAQNPTLVFAGNRLRITKDASGGRYTAPTIEAAGEVCGGEINVSETLTAERFRQTDVSPLSIVLRHEISCEDYGEVIDPEAGRLLGRAAKLRRRLQNLRRMLELTDLETEHCAESALMFVFGGEKTQERIEELEAAQRRLAFLDRMLTGLHSLSATAEDHLIAMARTTQAPDAARQPAAVDDAPGTIEDIEVELNQMAAEGKVDRDLLEERKEILSANEKLSRYVSDRRVNSSILARLRKREASWLEERQNLVAAIKSKDEELKKIISGAEALTESAASVPKAKLLEQLLAAAKKRPADDVLAVRSSSRFVRLMQRSMDSRQRRAAKYRDMAEQVRAELKALVDRLHRDYLLTSIKVEPDETGAARVTGRFTAGVKLFAKRLLLEDEEAWPGTTFETPNTGDKVKTYAREVHTVVEAK